VVRIQDDADAHRRVHGVSGHDELATSKHVDEPRSRTHCLSLLSGGENHRKLVAAQAGEHAVAPHLRAQGLRDEREQLVSGPMAQGVVDVFEVVEVEPDESAASAQAPLVGELTFELLLEAPAVEQTGQRVVTGKLEELLV